MRRELGLWPGGLVGGRRQGSGGHQAASEWSSMDAPGAARAAVHGDAGPGAGSGARLAAVRVCGRAVFSHARGLRDGGGGANRAQSLCAGECRAPRAHVGRSSASSHQLCQLCQLCQLFASSLPAPARRPAWALLQVRTGRRVDASAAP